MNGKKYKKERKNQMKAIQVKYFEMWNTSITMLWGKSPKVNMVCGKCHFHFSKRFEPFDFRSGYPKVMCPSCHTVNYVPIQIQ